jgi:hypothetical protein
LRGDWRQVGGGACDPKCCAVTGAATQGKVRAWEESNVLVTAADRYGTPCITGGRTVTAQLTPASKKVQPMTVDAVDNGDGTYRIPLLIMHEGVRSLPPLALPPSLCLHKALSLHLPASN